MTGLNLRVLRNREVVCFLLIRLLTVSFNRYLTESGAEQAAGRRDREVFMLNKQLLGVMLVSTADSHLRIQLN